MTRSSIERDTAERLARKLKARTVICFCVSFFLAYGVLYTGAAIGNKLFKGDPIPMLSDAEVLKALKILRK